MNKFKIFFLKGNNNIINVCSTTSTTTTSTTTKSTTTTSTTITKPATPPTSIQGKITFKFKNSLIRFLKIIKKYKKQIIGLCLTV